MTKAVKIFFIASVIVVALAVIFLIAALRGGGAKSGQQSKVTLNFWGTFDTSDVIAPMIQAYEQKHPNVQIIYTKKDVNTYEQDLIDALASGTGPDIFQIHNDWLPKYENKLIAAPASLVSLKNFTDTFVGVAKDDFVDGNNIYAMPLSVDTLGLYYNKDILASVGIATPPKTWAELRKDVQMITRSNGQGFFTRSGVAMGTTSNINRAVDILYLLMLQNGTVPYNSDHTQSALDQGIFDSSGNNFFPASNALSFYTSFANPNSDVYNWNQNSNYSIDSFANGQLAFMYGYSYARAQIVQKAPNLNFDVTFAPQPNLTQNPVNFANYWGNAVSKQSKAPNTAWDFIISMESSASLTTYYQHNKVPSSRLDLIEQQKNDPQLGIFAFQNLSAKSFYKKDQTKTDQVILNMIDDVILRNKTVSDAITYAVQQINLMLRQQ